MISEGSCDTEDWSNDAENSALHHKNKLYKYKTDILSCNNIFQYYSSYCVFDQINAALLRDLTFWMVYLYKKNLDLNRTSRSCWKIPYSSLMSAWLSQSGQHALLDELDIQELFMRSSQVTGNSHLISLSCIVFCYGSSKCISI